MIDCRSAIVGNVEMKLRTRGSGKSNQQGYSADAAKTRLSLKWV